jgi:histidine ammonia-lyase
VLPDGRVESNGNFHGAPVAYALDFLAIPIADVASMAERRTDRFLDPARNGGLPAFLAGDPGVDSGLMIAQYTQAAIVSELKRLAVPASVDSIPSSAMQEDHVSMGWSAARKLRKAVDGLARVLAIEVLTAARGIDLRCSPDMAGRADTTRSAMAQEAGEWASVAAQAPLSPAPGTAAVIATLREHVEGPGPDRPMSPEIEAAVELVRGGQLVRAAESAIGELL